MGEAALVDGTSTSAALSGDVLRGMSLKELGAAAGWWFVAYDVMCAEDSPTCQISR